MSPAEPVAEERGRARAAPGPLAPWALALALLALAPLAKASVPRAVATDGAALLVASLTEPSRLAPLAASDDVERLALFAGDDLAPEPAPIPLASRVRENRLSLHLGADAFGLEPLRGPPPLSEDLCRGDDECLAGTRIGGLTLLEPFAQKGEPKLTLELQWACSVSRCGLADGKPLDPWGLSWTTFAYGVAEGAINLALGTAQMMARPYLPAPLNNVNVSVNLTQPGKPVASASVPTVTEQLKSASTVIPVGEMLGRFTANLGLTVAGWFDPTAAQEYLDEVHSDLGRDTPGTAMVVAPLALKGGAAARAAIERRVPAFENPYTPEGLAGNPLLEGSSPAVTPKITLQQRGGNHHQIVRSIANQLTDQGYVVKGNGARFYDANGVTYTQTDLFAVRPTGDPMVLELKTGNAVTTPNQNLVYPQIMSGDALPSRSVARLLGIRPGIPLKDQGFPNGIPVYQVSAPGL